MKRLMKRLAIAALVVIVFAAVAGTGYGIYKSRDAFPPIADIPRDIAELPGQYQGEIIDMVREQRARMEQEHIRREQRLWWEREHPAEAQRYREGMEEDARRTKAERWKEIGNYLRGIQKVCLVLCFIIGLILLVNQWLKRFDEIDDGFDDGDGADYEVDNIEVEVARE